MLGGKEEQLLIGLTFYFENSLLLSFFLSFKIKRIYCKILSEEFVTIPGYENKFRALSNHVPNGKLKKRNKKEKKKKKKKEEKLFFVNINRQIYQSIHPKTNGTSKYI